MRKTPCPVLAICKAPQEASATGEERHHVHHLNRILFCTDFSENSELALNYAISATAEYDAELTLLHVLEDVPSPVTTKEAVATAAKQLDKLIPERIRKTLKYFHVEWPDRAIYHTMINTAIGDGAVLHMILYVMKTLEARVTA